MTPQAVGRDSSTLVLGRHSGLHGFSSRLKELGFILSEDDIKKTYRRFLIVADRKKEVFDDDLFVIISEELGHQADTYVLEYFNFQSGNMAVPTATVRVRIGEDTFEEAATGDGPVDAVFNAIDRAVGIKTILKEYNVRAVTPSRKAMGEVSVSVDIDDQRYIGRGASTDILEASARAYMNALNRHKTAQHRENDA